MDNAPTTTKVVAESSSEGSSSEGSSDDSSSDSDSSDDEMVKKTTNKASAESKTVKSHQKERFCRINIEPELKSVAGTRFADNSYEGTFGDEGWGAGASAILLQTRGKDFRHEKTKKKRGTYRGGKIDSMTTRSIKYDSSSDEE